MEITAKIINAGTLQVIQPSEGSTRRDPFSVRDVEVRYFVCIMGEAKAVDLVLHLTGKNANNFSPEHPWICADIYPSSRKTVTQDGREFYHTDVNVKSIAPIINF